MRSKEPVEKTVNYINREAFQALHSMECAMVGDIESLTIDEIESYVCQLRVQMALSLQAD
jgi:uncharacterized protein YhaN